MSEVLSIINFANITLNINNTDIFIFIIPQEISSFHADGGTKHTKYV